MFRPRFVHGSRDNSDCFGIVPCYAHPDSLSIGEESLLGGLNASEIPSSIPQDRNLLRAARFRLAFAHATRRRDNEGGLPECRTRGATTARAQNASPSRPARRGSRSPGPAPRGHSI